MSSNSISLKLSMKKKGGGGRMKDFSWLLKAAGEKGEVKGKNNRLNLFEYAFIREF